MKIDVLTVEGSPKNILPSFLEGRGVGGAELALITWGDLMAKSGHDIRIYNQTAEETWASNNIQYLPDNRFNPDDDRDILITFRGPNDVSKRSRYKKHIGWSCDQLTRGDYIDWYNSVDKMVLISEFHKEDHIRRYGENLVRSKAIPLDLGVRSWEYEQPIEKIPYQFIFCSIPDRGLKELYPIWVEIKNQLPEATLIITSDYTLWGASEPLNFQYKLQYAGTAGVKFVGNVPRAELVKYQLQSECQIYPCNYDENFCIANAECQVAGCYCITSDKGALKTTNFTGVQIPYPNAGYVEEAKKFFAADINTRKELQAAIRNKAFGRFSWQTIAKEWENIFEA